MVFVILTAFVCLGAIALMFGAPLLVLPVAALTSWIAMLTAAAKSDDRGKWRFALVGSASTLPLSVGLMLGFGPVAGYIAESPDGTGIASAIIAAFAFVVFMSLLFPLAYHARLIARNRLPFALAFLGMNALIAMAFVLWIQLNVVTFAATQMAIVGLVGLAAVVLVRHVRAGLRSRISLQMGEDAPFHGTRLPPALRGGADASGYAGGAGAADGQRRRLQDAVSGRVGGRQAERSGVGGIRIAAAGVRAVVRRPEEKRGGTAGGAGRRLRRASAAVRGVQHLRARFTTRL